MADLNDSAILLLDQQKLIIACPQIGGLTVSAIQTKVMQNLNDLGLKFYRNIDYAESFQDGYDDIACRTGCIEKTATIPWIPNLTYYDFSTLITDYLALKGIFNGRIRRWMIPSMGPELDGFRIDWENSNNEPQYFFPVNFRWVAFFQQPSSSNSSNNNMYVWYAAQADTLTPSSIPQIPYDQFNILEYYVTADLLDQSEEYSKADVFWALYEEKLEDLRKDTQNRKYPDKVKILAG